LSNPTFKLHDDERFGWKDSMETSDMRNLVWRDLHVTQKEPFVEGGGKTGKRKIGALLLPLPEFPIFT
jgi:hypothetical protein